MTIPLELAARIERLYTVERWRVGTIARQLNVHRDTVRRVLREHEVVPPGTPLRQSLVDPYRSFIRETLEKYPTLAASRLHDMVCERGYAGQASHFRCLVSTMRPRPPAEAYLRLRTLPGEEMQVDWAHFDHLQIGRARRPLMGFVMVPRRSRRVFLRFCLNAQMDSLPSAAMSTRSPHLVAWPGPRCTTTSRASCSSAWATPSASIPNSLHLPSTTASSRARWPWRAATTGAPTKLASWGGGEGAGRAPHRFHS